MAIPTTGSTLVLIRTDFVHPEPWARMVRPAGVLVVDRPGYDGLQPQDVLDLTRGPQLSDWSTVALADRVTLTRPDAPLLVVAARSSWTTDPRALDAYRTAGSPTGVEAGLTCLPRGATFRIPAAVLWAGAQAVTH